jgi:hypothetical protein
VSDEGWPQPLMVARASTAPKNQGRMMGTMIGWYSFWVLPEQSIVTYPGIDEMEVTRADTPEQP